MSLEQDDERLLTPETFKFPYTPYIIQQDFMTKLYKVLESKKFGIFESPTGTGKSLSIICSSLKWLYDHNEQEKSKRESQVEMLEIQRRSVSDSGDWISSQAEEIEITHKINAIKLDLRKIQDYETKIDNLRKKVLKATKAFNKNSKNISEESDTFLGDDNNNNDIEDIDLVLNDSERDEDEDLFDNDEEKYEPVKIYICSRTHSQLSQLVSEIQKTSYKSEARVITLSSRMNYCINNSVRNLKNVNSINERCLDLQKKQIKYDTDKDADGRALKKRKGKECSCPFFKQSLIEDLSNLALNEIQDVEDLVNNGKKLKACPYYASRKANEDAQIVLVPYNTILHDATRKANGIKLKNNIVIIDEAHNLLEAICQMYSSEVTYNSLGLALQQLKNYKSKFSSRFSSNNLLCINQLIHVISKLFKYLDETRPTNNKFDEVKTVQSFVLTVEIDHFNMFKLIEFIKKSGICNKLHHYVLKFPEADKQEVIKEKGVRQFLSEIGNKLSAENIEVANDKPKVLNNPLPSILSFLEKLTYSYDDARILIHLTQENSKRKFKFMLLNPSSPFAAIVKESRSVIVAGGTMKPLSEFRRRLFENSGVSPDRIVEFSCNHIVSPNNILPMIIGTNQDKQLFQFNYEKRYSMGNNLLELLQEVCKKVVGGIVVFFPSYSYEEWFWQQVKNVSFGRKIFREPHGSSSVDNILDSYAKTIKKCPSTGAMIFSVVGGKLSEGLNFSDELGRCVIVVGMPYADITSEEIKQKMAYLDRNEGEGSGRAFYEYSCMKAVNQCVGRAIRHRNDYAAILLIDDRYNRRSIKDLLPDWITVSLKNCDFEESFTLMDNFFNHMKSN